MHVALLNPQGNFDARDSHWTEHPDFGGQLVYVKNVALGLARLGHRVDILTRQIVDPDWPEFAARFDRYPGVTNVRIIRLPAGPPHFLPKEDLWPYIARDWVPNILSFYAEEGGLPAVFSAHYGDGGIAAVLLEDRTGIPFTFTAHSLGAQKMDALEVTRDTLAAADARFHFARRLVAERLSMNRAAKIIVSTRLERFEQYGHRAYRGAVDIHDDERFAVIPPGVNTDIFTPEPQPGDAATHRHIRNCLVRDISAERREFPAILMSARLDAKKNHVGLVRAFASSPPLKAGANLVLITAGADDPLRTDRGLSPAEQVIVREVRSLVKAHNLWGMVSAFALRGQPALAAAYRFFRQQRSVFVLPALFEPFGLAPLEAAACGLPVVVTRHGGPSEVFREGDETFGVLVDPADENDLARGLARVVLDPRSWELLATKGRERVLSRFTWDHTAQGYARVLAEITQHPRRRSNRLPIPGYFLDPRPETDISLEVLADLYL